MDPICTEEDGIWRKGGWEREEVGFLHRAQSVPGMLLVSSPQSSQIPPRKPDRWVPGWSLFRCGSGGSWDGHCSGVAQGSSEPGCVPHVTIFEPSSAYMPLSPCMTSVATYRTCFSHTLPPPPLPCFSRGQQGTRQRQGSLCLAGGTLGRLRFCVDCEPQGSKFIQGLTVTTK